MFVTPARSAALLHRYPRQQLTAIGVAHRAEKATFVLGQAYFR